jgi:tRNA-specific 2-thiouridylase
VVDKDLPQNVLVVGQGAAHPRLLSRALRFGELHWISSPPDEDQTLGARIRYRQADQRCRLRYLAGNRAELRFAEPQRAVTPGQYAVLYRGDECLGGGVIEERIT